MQLLKMIGLVMLGSACSIQASESVTITSETGDILMIHHLNNGEVWGSLMITDQIPDSFSDSELIVLQVDQHQPIKLDAQKLCGGGKGEKQKVSYDFLSETNTEEWQFSSVEATKPDAIKLFGWDKDTYQHMRSDRRPEVVDFPIMSSIAIQSLRQQFQQGEEVTFRYTTDAGEIRQAHFELSPAHDSMNQLLNAYRK